MEKITLMLVFSLICATQIVSMPNQVSNYVHLPGNVLVPVEIYNQEWGRDRSLIKFKVYEELVKNRLESDMQNRKNPQFLTVEVVEAIGTAYVHYVGVTPSKILFQFTHKQK